MLSAKTLTTGIQIAYEHNSSSRYFVVKMPERLTKSEKEVLCNLLKGMRVSDIAKKLHRSIKTVSNQKRTLYTKLNVKSDVTLFCDLYFDGVVEFTTENTTHEKYNVALNIV